MANDDFLFIDNEALSYLGKVILNRSIAYFEKFKAKEPCLKASQILVISSAIATPPPLIKSD